MQILIFSTNRHAAAAVSDVRVCCRAREIIFSRMNDDRKQHRPIEMNRALFEPSLKVERPVKIASWRFVRMVSRRLRS